MAQADTSADAAPRTAAHAAPVVIERELSVRAVLTNPVPLLVVGPAAQACLAVESIVGVADAIISVFDFK